MTKFSWNLSFCRNLYDDEEDSDSEDSDGDDVENKNRKVCVFVCLLLMLYEFGEYALFFTFSFINRNLHLRQKLSM